MNTIDILIIFIWTLATFIIGIWAGLKSNFNTFWVNNRNTSVLALVMTIVATQIGGGTILGIASSSYTSGTGFGLVAVISTVTGFITLAFLSKKIKEFGDKTNAITLPEIIGHRFGQTAQISSGVIIFLAYLSMLGGQLLATSIIIKTWSGISYDIALIISGGGVIIYSAFAGLKGDIITDKLHFILMFIIFILILFPIILIKEPIINIINDLPSEIISPVTFGGYTYLIAGIMFGLIIPVVSMELWLRIFASQDSYKAKKSLIISAIFVVPFYLVPLLIGLISYSTFPTVKNPDSILIMNLFKYLPTGFLGLGVASLFAVLISTANTLIVVLGATIYRDILGKPVENTKINLKTSRLITLSVGILGALLAFLISDIVQLVLNAFFMISILFPAILSALFFKGTNKVGGMLSIILGGITTICFIPIYPTQAFLPGLVVSILTIVISNFIKKNR